MTGLMGVLGGASALAGLAAALTSVISAIVARNAWRTATNRLEIKFEQSVLQSADIQTLGKYLYENVGDTRIASYVRHDDLRDKVTRTLETITDFLGPKMPPEPESPEPRPILPEPLSQIAGPEMETALQEIRFGEVWNGLARMRRFIEMRLQAIDPDRSKDKAISVGRILNGLIAEKRIPTQAVELLRYAIQVANAGIHGREVDAAQAEEAWISAVRALAILEDGHDLLG